MGAKNVHYIVQVRQQPPPDIKLKNINSNMDGKMKDNCYDIISSAFFVILYF
jgi:hypothetical protein